MELLKKWRGVGLVVAVIFSVAGCKSDNNQTAAEKAAAAVACGDVPKALEDANKAQASAEAELKTHDGGKNKNAVRDAKDAVKALTARKSACDAGTATTTATTTAGTTGDTSSSTSSPATTDPVISDELINLLTVTTVTATPCTTLVGDAGLGTVQYHIGALEQDVTHPGGKRLWSDAYSTPVVEPTDPVKQLAEIDVESCVNPHFGVGDLWRFAHLTVGNVKIVDLNPWLKPFAVDASQINDLAAQYTFLDLTDVQKKDPQVRSQVVDKNIEWQALAARLNTLRGRLAIAGDAEWSSSMNLHLIGGGLSVGTLPEVGIAEQPDVKKALILSVTEKNCGVIALVGYNLGDKRPEDFIVTVNCTPPTTTTTGPCRTCGHTTTTTTPCGNCGTTTTTTQPTTTTVVCASGKCDPGTTVAPSSETTVPRTTTTQPAGSPTTVSAGTGATNTSVPPTTVAPPATVPNTAPPSTNPPKPGG